MIGIDGSRCKPACRHLALAGPVGFGAWPIGNGTNTYGQVDEDEALAALRLYIDSGGSFIDTARAYGERSERLVGQAVRESGRRDSVIVATKSAAGETRDSIPQLRQDLETSLRTMKLDAVDLFQLHQPPEDPEVMAQVMEETDRFRQEGKVRSVGASVKGPNVTDGTVRLCLQYVRSGKIDAIQVVYSVLRQKLAPVMKEAARRGIFVIARSVLESGFLAGLAGLGLGEPGSMRSFLPPDQRSRYSEARLRSVVEGAREFERICAASPLMLPPALIAAGFALSGEGVMTIIPGMRNRRHVRDNMEIAPVFMPSAFPDAGGLPDSRSATDSGGPDAAGSGTGTRETAWKDLHDLLVCRFRQRNDEFNYS